MSKKRAFGVATILLCICILTSCGQKEKADLTLEPHAGLYLCLGYKVEAQCAVEDGLVRWNNTLKEDSTGSPYWGEDTKGPLSEWGLDGEKLVIPAGASVMKGTLSDSTMLVDFGDGIVLGWAMIRPTGRPGICFWTRIQRTNH